MLSLINPSMFNHFLTDFGKDVKKVRQVVSTCLGELHVSVDYQDSASKLSANGIQSSNSQITLNSTPSRINVELYYDFEGSIEFRGCWSCLPLYTFSNPNTRINFHITWQTVTSKQSNVEITMPKVNFSNLTVMQAANNNINSSSDDRKSSDACCCGCFDALTSSIVESQIRNQIESQLNTAMTKFNNFLQEKIIKLSTMLFPIDEINNDDQETETTKRAIPELRCGLVILSNGKQQKDYSTLTKSKLIGLKVTIVGKNEFSVDNIGMNDNDWNRFEKSKSNVFFKMDKKMLELIAYNQGRLQLRKQLKQNENGRDNDSNNNNNNNNMVHGILENKIVLNNLAEFTLNNPQILIKSIVWTKNGFVIKIDGTIDIETKQQQPQQQEEQGVSDSKEQVRENAKEKEKEKEQGKAGLTVPIRTSLQVIPIIWTENERKGDGNNSNEFPMKRVKAKCINVTPDTDIGLIDNINSNVGYYAFNMVDSIIKTGINQVNNVSKSVENMFGIKIDQNSIFSQVAKIFQQLNQKEVSIIRLTRQMFFNVNVCQIGFQTHEIIMLDDCCVFNGACNAKIK